MVPPAVGVAGLGEMLDTAWPWWLFAWAWARTCWGTITNWPVSVRTRTMPGEENDKLFCTILLVVMLAHHHDKDAEILAHIVGGGKLQFFYFL